MSFGEQFYQDGYEEELYKTQDRQLRYNKGKPLMSYILTFYKSLRGVVQVCMYGESKYERGNYLKGDTVSAYLDSGLRHLFAFYGGEDYDPESGEHHLDHANWNFLRAREMTFEKDRDDRIKPNNE